MNESVDVVGVQFRLVGLTQCILPSPDRGVATPYDDRESRMAGEDPCSGDQLTHP